jgi:hypothetical protein
VERVWTRGSCDTGSGAVSGRGYLGRSRTLLKHQGADATRGGTLRVSDGDTLRGMAFRHTGGDGENCQEVREGALERHDLRSISL